MTTPLDQTRAAFEAHFSSEQFGLSMERCEETGTYFSQDTRLAWEAWQAAIASRWVPVDERLPEPGKAVLLDCGETTPIRALWAAKHTVEAGDEFPEDWAEYDEATDTYYVPPGWYEWNRHEETHWRVHATARAWCEIPTPPIAAKAAKETT